MVLQKRLDYGSHGYHQVPALPQVPRSARGKRSVRKKVEENRMCAFELLATVAGKLLLEKDHSSNPRSTTGISNPSTAKDIFKQEQVDDEEPFKVEAFDHGSCNESTLASDLVIQKQVNFTLKERSQSPKAKALTSAASAGELIINGSRGVSGYCLGTISKKCSTEGGSPDSAESFDGKFKDGIKTPLQPHRQMIGDVIGGIAIDNCILEDPVELDTKLPVLISSVSTAEVPLCGDNIPRNGSFPDIRDNMELVVDRDDDDNLSRCTQHRTLNSTAYRPQRIGDHNIRKLLATKFWKVGPAMLKNGGFSNSDVEMKPFIRSNKMHYTRRRSQRYPFKRRKFFERRSISASDGWFSGESISNSPAKHIKREASDSHLTLHGANGTSSTLTAQKSSYESADFHVKFSIKSFKVPELFIEIPETATVGSLKRTVMEAVTAILVGGHVGILLQGKKVRDDNETLLQAGISHGDMLDNLGFTLEPNAPESQPMLRSPKDPHFLLPCDVAEPQTRMSFRIPAAALASDIGSSDSCRQTPLTTIANCSESDYDSVYSPTDTSSPEKTIANSRSLVAIPAVTVEALAMVPLHRNKSRLELVQRRIRRPFSVMEVEALVEAVEKLGTGRWRDVKLRSFDNAKHRTYVDLKDKWKTLVHTARISPQQRRGEPVPQELLDRVLSAHSYWFHQHAKLQV